jgi:hypothetical protein
MTKYHWILTVMVEGGKIEPLHGTLDAVPGATRSNVFDWALATMRDTVGHDRFATMFFSLERNDLDGGAS